MALSGEQHGEIHDIFRTFLKERGLRQTTERFAVLDMLYDCGEHVDADQLYIGLKQQGRRISRATVYNTLTLLLDCQLAVRHQFGNSQAKYEPAYRYWQHDHLICLDCQAVLEFCDPRIHSIQKMVAEIYRFDITSHALNLYGHCLRENCSNRPAPVVNA